MIALDQSYSAQNVKNLRTKTIRGAGWSAVGTLFGQVVSFVVFLLLARLLSLEQFGLIALANIYVLVVQLFVFQGLGQAIIQFDDLDDLHLDTVFWMNLAAGVFFFALTLVSANFVAGCVATPDLAPVLRWLSPIFLLAALTDVQNNLLTRRMAFFSLAMRTLISYVAGGVVGVAMALHGAGAWSIVGQQLTIWVLNVIVLWSASEWRPHFRFSIAHARRLTLFGINLLWVDVASLANRRADQFFVGRYLGSVAVGIYAVAARISMLLAELVVRSFSRVSLSAFARLQNDPPRLARGFYEVVEMQLACVLPVAIGVALFAPSVVSLFFGAKWIAAAPIIQVLMIALPFEALSAVHFAILISRGRPQWCSLLTLGHALVNVVAFCFAIRFGMLAVSAAFAVRAALFYPVELHFVHRLIPISFVKLFLLLAAPLVATIAMTGGVRLVEKMMGPPSSLVWLCSAIAAGAVIYGLILSLLRPRLVRDFWKAISVSFLQLKPV